MKHMKPATMLGIVWLSFASPALGAAIELSGGGGDVGALLRIPIPAGILDAKPGDALTLTDENGKQISAQVELRGICGESIELVLVRKPGTGRRLRIGKVKPAGTSTPYAARRDGNKTVSLTVNDEEISRYQLAVLPLEGHPGYEFANYFHPLVTPSGVIVSDKSPDDHRHHRGLFMAFTDFTRVADGKKLHTDFWHPQKDPKTRIGAGRLYYARGGSVCATMAAGHDYWIGGDVVMVQDWVARAARLSDRVNVLDIDIRVTATGGNVQLGKNFYSCLQFRGARAFKRPEQVFTFADGKERKKDVNEDKMSAPYDRWFDLTAPVNGKRVGATLAVHPTTPKSRLCYARSVKGLNPNFVFDKPVRLRAGQTIRCRYQVYMHDGTVAEAKIADIAAWYTSNIVANWSR